MKFIFLPITLLILIFPVTACPVTPLYYHTFAVAEIEASVEEICIVGIPTLKTDEFMRGKSKEESMYIREVQKIRLKVIRVIKFERKDSKVENILEGETIKITNPFTDQTPPFKVGDKIKTRIRLVLPEETYNPQDQRKQWWFFPLGEKEDIFPPRHPFKGIKVIEKANVPPNSLFHNQNTGIEVNSFILTILPQFGLTTAINNFLSFCCFSLNRFLFSFTILPRSCSTLPSYHLKHLIVS